MSCSPDFIGIGAQRAGTSWIYACLYDHPELCLPEKEINFFSRDRNWTKGLEWYEAHFEDCARDQLAGEFSTSYLTAPPTAERIQEHYPEIKLIVSLRNPVERAYSSYKNDIVGENLDQDVTFESALQRDDKYLDWGKYATHLNSYLDHFNRDQLLILVYENSLEAPAKFIQKIYKFLGVDDGHKPSMLHRKINRSRNPVAPGVDTLSNKIANFLRNNSLLRPIWWALKKSGVGQLIRSINSRGTEEEGINPQLKKQLYTELKPEIESVEEKFDLDLNHWKPEAQKNG